MQSCFGSYERWKTVELFLKQETIGHIAHPRKQFKSINIYNYHNLKPIIYCIRIEWFLIWTWIPFTQECIVPSLVKIDPVIREKKIF